jgi:hypothetical protein
VPPLSLGLLPPHPLSNRCVEGGRPDKELQASAGLVVQQRLNETRRQHRRIRQNSPHIAEVAFVRIRRSCMMLA